MVMRSATIGVLLATSLACSIRDDTCAAADPSTTSDVTASADTGDPPPMFCQPMCTVPADCCPSPENIPPGVSCPNDYPFAFVCPDGVCRPAGCTCDDECHRGGETDDQVCLMIDGIGFCRLPCASDEECASQFSACTGVSDVGIQFCDPSLSDSCEPGDDCEGAGVCIDGACGCADNADCSDGWGCTPRW